jgi:hypothetical protein
MSPADEPSERVILQRMRNRAIEALDTLADADEGVRALGVVEYVEEFFDVIDDRAAWYWKTWSTLTAEEVAAIDRVQQLVLEACAAAPVSWQRRNSLLPAGRPVLSRRQSRPLRFSGLAGASARTSRKISRHFLRYRSGCAGAQTCCRPGQGLRSLVVRGGVEPPTFRFSGGRSYRLSYLTVTSAGHGKWLSPGLAPT